MNARMYNENTPTFLSLDPASQYNPSRFLHDPQQLNLYAYARNNPVRYNDPSGEFVVKTGKVEKGDTLGKITKILNQVNGTKYTINQVARLNNIKDPNKISVGQTLIPNEKIPDITRSLKSQVIKNATDPTINEVGKLGTAGIKNFYNKVKTGGEWDYKNDPTSTYYAPNSPDGFVFEAKNVTNDFSGNFNYGYVGSSTWWGTKSFLLRSAGIGQTASNLKRGGLPVWNPPYFDNRGDSEQIIQGINAYHSY